MALTVTITNVQIDTLRVNYDTDPLVVVSYALKDASGRVWYTGDAFFWTALPTNPSNEDYLLPTSYIGIFADLRIAADQAITNRLGV